jgi:hypothetical protein
LLVLASIAFALVGLAVAFVPSLFAPWHTEMVRAFFAADAYPPRVAGFVAFFLGPIGGTIAGKWLAQAFIAAGPFAKRERWSLHASAAGLVVWFAVDSATSVTTGAWMNVVLINLAPLLVVGAILAAAAPRFRGPSPPPPAAPTFWDRWLFVAFVVTAVAGALLPVVDRLLLTPWYGAAARQFFAAGDLPPAVAPMAHFLTGVLGGTMAGQAVLLAFVTRHAYFRRERWARGAIWASLLGWFVVDSAASALRGAWFNVLWVNVPYLAVLVPPLAATYQAFGRSSSSSSSER